jgi:hypothetical protein
MKTYFLLRSKYDEGCQPLSVSSFGFGTIGPDEEQVKVAALTDVIEFLEHSGQHPNTQSAIDALKTLLS